MGFQIFNFEDNSNVSVVSRKGIFKVIQYDKDLSCTAEDAQTKFCYEMTIVKRKYHISLGISLIFVLFCFFQSRI